MKQVSITPKVRAPLPKKSQDFFSENLLGIFYPDYHYHSYHYYYHHYQYCTTTTTITTTSSINAK